MIRVNLLKTRVSSVGEGDVETRAIPEFRSGSGGAGNAMINFAIILACPLLLYLLDSYLTSAAQQRYQKINQKVSRLENQLDKKRQASKDAQKLQSRIKELEKKTNILKELSKTRMVELKALDYLQSIIPERVWLREVSYEGQQFVLEGRAVGEDDLNSFLDRLEGQSYFENVILKSSTEEKVDEGSVRAFEVSTQISL